MKLTEQQWQRGGNKGKKKKSPTTERQEGWKNGLRSGEGIAERRGASVCGRQHRRGKQEERDVVCVTQFCVLTEDSTAISPSASSQHHHRDNEVGKIRAEAKIFKSIAEVSVLLFCAAMSVFHFTVLFLALSTFG